MKKLCLCIFFALLVSRIWAVRVDSLAVYSAGMKKDVKVVAVLPDRALHGEACPVLYLLHGYGGNEKSWITIKPELLRMAERDGIIVVCPDGRNSWYWDSPTHPDSRYETFVADELVHYVDSHYATIAQRSGRAIAGLSMGGHGALWLAIRHKSVFGAAGSTSGGVDIRPFPDNWEMKTQLGPEKTNQRLWDDHTVITQLDSIRNGDLALIIDCGADDFFLKVNLSLHRQLADRGIAHDFIVRPGAHTLEYWNNSIDYQWLFFRKYFSGYRGPQQ